MMRRRDNRCHEMKIFLADAEDAAVDAALDAGVSTGSGSGSAPEDMHKRIPRGLGE